MERFYNQDLSQNELELDGSELHHLKNVLRVRPGELVELFDGLGTLAQAEVGSIHPKTAHLTIIHKKTYEPPRSHVQLGVSLLRLNRLEWTVEKATELGADKFFLFEAERSEKKELSAHQRERLQHVVLSACKQCKRLYLPSVEWISSLDSLFEQTTHSIYFGDLRPQAPSISTCTLPSHLLFVTGPEKGFSKNEEALLDKKGYGVRLSRNVLRAETAPITATALFIERIDSQ